MTVRPLRALLVALVSLSLAAGCGVGETRRRNDRILDSGEEAAEQRYATYMLSITSRRKPMKDQPARPIEPPADITLAGRIAFRPDRATIGSPGQPEVVVFDDTWMYVRRHRRGIGSTDARGWARFDFANTDVREEAAIDIRGSLGLLWLNPSYLVTMPDGALTGSLRNRGTEQVGGVATTHWTANYDIQKAIREDDEEQRKAVIHSLRTMGHRGPSFRGGVWIDANGIARRFAMTLEQRIDPENILLTTFTIELSAIGERLDLDVPPRTDTKSVRNQVRLLLELDIPGRS